MNYYLMCFIYGALVGIILFLIHLLDKVKLDMNSRVKENFEFIKEKLKCCKLYKVEAQWGMNDKCKYCDENRNITLELPNGEKRVEKCSCAKYVLKKYVIKDYAFNTDREYGFSYSNKGTLRVHLFDEEWTIDVITNQSEYDKFIKNHKIYSVDVLFKNKTLAQKYLNYLKGKKK